MDEGLISDNPRFIQVLVPDPSGQRYIMQHVVQVYGRCNFDCTYCNIFNLLDDGTVKGKAKMSRPVMVKVAERIGEYVRLHGGGKVNVQFHGGEPLMLGASDLDFFCRTLKDAMPVFDLGNGESESTLLELSVQTNGSRLKYKAILDVIGRHRIKVSVSFDGTEADHNRKRVNHAGRGTYAGVLAGIHALMAVHPELFYKGLCFVDTETDPIKTFEAICEVVPPYPDGSQRMVDLLLPLGNHEYPPPGLEFGSGTTPYADWLIEVYDAWVVAGSSTAPIIRLFDEIYAGLLGRQMETEVIGPQVRGHLTFGTDGRYLNCDGLMAAGNGLVEMGPTVFGSSIQEVIDWLEGSKWAGMKFIPDACVKCPNKVCAGGYWVHRFGRAAEEFARWGEHFNHQSVYCADLWKLIHHIGHSVPWGQPPLKDYAPPAWLGLPAPSWVPISRR